MAHQIKTITFCFKAFGLGIRNYGFGQTRGFRFEASQALADSGRQFVGLALDDENEFEHTDARIQAWCEQIAAEFGLN